jgi:hypothetical protein
VGAFGISKIQLGKPQVDLFKENTEIVQSDRFINEHMNGSSVLNVILSGKKIDAPADQDNNEHIEEIDDSDFGITGDPEDGERAASPEVFKSYLFSKIAYIAKG